MVGRIVFVACLLVVTGYCSYIGDDDVVYQYLDRKPTPQEGVRRIRWALLKATASIYGGALLAAAVLVMLRACCAIVLAGDPAVLISFACMGVVCLLIGVVQNGIRILRGRPTRPLIDRVVWQRSFGKIERKR